MSGTTEHVDWNNLVNVNDRIERGLKSNMKER